MRQFEGLEDPPLFADDVPTVAASEGVYLISFAAPVIPESPEAADGIVTSDITGGPIVATLALTTSAAMSLASRLCMLITHEDEAQHLPA